MLKNNMSSIKLIQINHIFTMPYSLKVLKLITKIIFHVLCNDTFFFTNIQNFDTVEFIDKELKYKKYR
jgi:hypothetical protein